MKKTRYGKRSIILAAFLFVAAALTFVGLSRQVKAVEYDSLVVSGDDLSGVSYDQASRVVTINTSAAITIYNSDQEIAVNTTISVAAGCSPNITLAGVNIDATRAAFEIAESSTGNVTITLENNTVNKLKSISECAGLQKNGTAGKLIIQGNGTLNATGGGRGAGIGGSDGCSSGNIEITGGTINARGGNGGAGIGGGSGGSGSDITIEGGIINAIGGDDGAGIGGGSYLNIGTDYSGINITITGGTVTAKGGNGAAGIGGGSASDASGIIITSDASVKAVGGDAGANAIGGSFTPATPTLADGTTPVYLTTLDLGSGFTGSTSVLLGGVAKTYAPHESGDTCLYFYLPAGTYTAAVGSGADVSYYKATVSDSSTTFAAVTPDLKVSGGTPGID